MSSRSVPVPADRTDSRPESVVTFARSTPVYFVQPSPRTATVSGAASSAPALSSRETETSVPVGESVRAQTEKSYGRPALTATPLL
jgi:hypothetical protein